MVLQGYNFCIFYTRELTSPNDKALAVPLSVSGTKKSVRGNSNRKARSREKSQELYLIMGSGLLWHPSWWLHTFPGHCEWFIWSVLIGLISVLFGSVAVLNDSQSNENYATWLVIQQSANNYKCSIFRRDTSSNPALLMIFVNDTIFFIMLFVCYMYAINVSRIKIVKNLKRCFFFINRYVRFRCLKSPHLS